MKYKLTIYGDRFLKEIKLDEKWESGLYIGTTPTSHMRFSKDLFKVEFELCILAQNGLWQAFCSQGVALQNNQGISESVVFDSVDMWRVVDRATGQKLFDFEFAIDFENKTGDFYTKICTSGASEISVGGPENCSVRIKDPALGADYVYLRREAQGWCIYTAYARYGVLINGVTTRATQYFLKDRDFFNLNGYTFYWKDENLYTGSNVDINSVFSMITSKMEANHLNYPKFIRSVRQEFVIPTEKINVLQPTGKPEPSKRNIIMTILPTLLSIGMMLMLRMTMNPKPIFIVMCVGMGLVGVSTSIINYRSENSDYRKNLVKRENDYNKYIAETEEKIQKLQEKEKVISQEKYPDVSTRLMQVKEFDARLFEKQREHEDFLTIRLGSGIVESKCEVTYKEQEYRQVEDPLADYPMLLSEKYRYISEMPVVLDLNDRNAIGFIGDRTHLYQMMKNLLLQVCIEHYYQDIKTVILMHQEDTGYFNWARWFRNITEEGSGIRYIAYDEDSYKLILERLYTLLSERDKKKSEELKAEPTIMIFAYRSDIMSEHPLSLFVEKAKDLKCIFIFFEDYPEKVNMYCEKRIFLNGDEMTGYIQDARDGEDIVFFAYERIPSEQAQEAAMKMAGVYVDEVSLESTLTKNITLYELLDIRNIRDLDLGSRWKSSRIYDTMAAPLGVKAGDEVVYLDLHEKYHGPHGLVAGTTGSGKSEILQTYILSMATLFHPYEVGFIIIDFKGGGMVNQFKNLPHLNGAITNIDGKEIDRSLSSIKAELQKRQRLFAANDVNHINDYIKLYKEGKTSHPLPHLILIVDEFAELKSEQPEFMKELISAARIGRSLGVHLILATQKPSGVVNDQIWSNSKFKLCLKVQDKSDSNEVIKSPLAAEIREPGRAYLQVGNNEIFELFQSAYSGAPVPNSAMGQMKSFKVSLVDLCGRRGTIFEQKPKKDDSGVSQLDAIVEYVSDYCSKNNIKRLPNICLPPLEGEIAYDGTGYENVSTDVCVPIGIYDAPELQAQEIMDVNFTQGHIFIVGSSQMGKTNLLQNMIRGIVERYSSDEVQIYILDFASMILKNFEDLKHVGEVIIPTDEEKPAMFLKNMVDEIQKRKDALSAMGLSSYSTYRESGQNQMRQIVIMLDNIAVFRELNPQIEDKLLKITREGASVGICLVATAMQCQGLGFRYMSNFSKRIALFCNDSGEYMSVFDRCRNKLDQIPGRCFIALDKKIYEGQTYIAFPAEKEIERIKEIRSFIEKVNQADKGSGANATPVIPDSLTADQLNQAVTEERTPYTFAVGLNYETVDADIINLSVFNLLGISDEEGPFGQATAKRIISELLDKQETAPVNFYVFDSPAKRLGEFEDKVALYTTDATRVVEEVRRVVEGLKNKTGAAPYDCFILNSTEVYKLLGEDEEICALCKNAMVQYRDKGISFIISDLPNESLSSCDSKFIKLLNNASNLIMFEPLDKLKICDVGMNTKNKYKNKKLKPGDAWFRCGLYFALYKTPNA